MLKYKINMEDALKRAKFNTYKAKTSGLLSQDTLKKVKAESTDISLKALNSLCLILDMPPGAILDFEATEEEIERKKEL